MNKIQSGHDIEFLIGEEYIRHMLLLMLDTGTFPWWSKSEKKDENGNVIDSTMFIIHPPEELKDCRLYPVHPEFEGNEHPLKDVVPLVYSGRGAEEFKVTILPGNEDGPNVRIQIFPSIILHAHDEEERNVPISNLLEMNLDLKLSITHDDPDEHGIIYNIRLKTELMDISGGLIDVADNYRDVNGEKAFSKKDTLADLKNTINRESAFQLSGNQGIQYISMKVLAADDETSPAIGIYIDLNLLKGPGEFNFLPERQALSEPQNFLPKGSGMIFGIPSAIFKKLGNDAFYKLAKLKEGSTDKYEYPLMDGNNRIGTVKGISVYPQMFPGNKQDTLVIDISAEYSIDNMFDPDFHARIHLTPKNKNGLLEFEVDAHVSIDPLIKALLILAEIAITCASVGLGATLLLLTPAGLVVAEHLLSDKATSTAKSRPEIASLMDMLPHKLMIEKRRWDPFYETSHQLEIEADNICVNEHGFAFSAGKICIGRKFEPVGHVVIRKASINKHNYVDGLYYRVNDFGNYEIGDFADIFPAVDRMSYTKAVPPDGEKEPWLVLLSSNELTERGGVPGKLLKFIPYEAYKVDVRDHQIYRMLVISDMETDEIQKSVHDQLADKLSSENDALYNQTATTELTAELGRTPTTDEISERVKQLLEADITEGLYEAMEGVLKDYVTFELEPGQFAELQNRQLMALGNEKLKLIKLHLGNKITLYYRDMWNKPWPEQGQDNLMALPKYHSEDVFV